MPKNILQIFRWSICAWIGVALTLSGCGKKASVNKQVMELERAFPAATNAASAQAYESPPAPAGVAADPTAYVHFALAAVRTNGYAAGVIALQAAQHLPGLNHQQLIAMENAKQAMTAELLARASRGDARAKADLAALEKTHSQ